jgi:hypothetical protein
MDSKGRVEALAAGGLKTVTAGDFSLRLEQRADIALWKNRRGDWEGVIRDADSVPPQLRQITEQWRIIHR